MKKIILAAILMVITYSSAIANTLTIKMEDGKYVNTGVQIPLNGTINIPAYGNSRVGFNINTAKPSGLVTEGYLRVYLKKTSTSSPTSVYNLYCTNSFWTNTDPSTLSRSIDITLYASDFNQSGGTIYAEFENNAGAKYTGNSYPVEITYPAIMGNSIASNQSVIQGQTPNMLTGSTPSGGSGSFTYQWQISTNNSTWSNISGATSVNYSPPILNITTYFRRFVNSQYVAQSISNVVTITFGVIVNIISPSIQTVCRGNTPQIITGNQPLGNVTYQWYIWPFGPNGGYEIAGATSKDYLPTSLSRTFAYHREVRVNGISISSSKVVVSISGLSNNTITQRLISPSTGILALSGSSPTCGDGTYTYQWQQKINGTWTDMEPVPPGNFFSTSLTFQVLRLSGTYTYRRVVFSGSEISYSNEIVVNF